MQLAILILQVLILLLLGGLVLLYKTFLTSYLKEKGKNIATKQDIAAITVQVESVKSQFLEHQTKFSLYHQKRFEAEARVFELLHDADEYIKHMVHPMQYGGDQEEADRRQLAFDAFNELSAYYWKHKIYLPTETCEKIEVVLDAMKDVAVKYRIGRDSHTSERGLTMWNEAWKTMENEVPKLRTELEDHFRQNVTVPSTNENEA